MKLLLTNDDGIDAPGLQALERAARGLGPLLTVAPTETLSGCSHRVTTDRPLCLEARGEARYAVDGMPADCVRVALHALAPEIDWVLSGINAGGNLGADVWHSGTVAAVREGVLHGKPGVAVSGYRRRGMEFDWSRASQWAATVLRELLSRRAEPGAFWNVNLPHLGPDEPEPRVVWCRLDPTPLPLSYRDEGGRLHYDGDYHLRGREPGADVDVCFRGNIAVTRLSLF